MFKSHAVVELETGLGISTNPFDFEATVPSAGVFTFAWSDDDGAIYTDTKAVTVAWPNSGCVQGGLGPALPRFYGLFKTPA
ncbi:thiosulfate oxidation carrier complex protein SoxZ [Ruegeria sp. EL01]|jgi:hypothetical protein|uniref:thiosulfate oxidation carrier complex protein SoxZ n=1 Tax=Ruegeria sp. EL01 TaxID=2107578 RepID=UPI000EA81C98